MIMRVGIISREPQTLHFKYHSTSLGTGVPVGNGNVLGPLTVPPTKP